MGGRVVNVSLHSCVCHVEAGAIAAKVRTMCGILAALGVQGDRKDSRVKVVRASQLQRHRGPDSTTVWESKDGDNFLAFERLNIVDATEAGRCEKSSPRLPAIRRTADHALTFGHPAPCPCATAAAIPRPQSPLACCDALNLPFVNRRQPFTIETPEGPITWAL